jgi:type IV pilus assembly protein PilA
VIEAIQRRLAARSDEEREGGFTLIELMVVVMIIAILVGIAIPAFLGARKRAQDTASKSNLRNALGTAQTIYTDNQTYLATAGMVTDLTNEEPSLTFQDDTTASGTAKTINILTKNSGITGVTGLDEIILASKSASGKCFYLRHVSTAGNALSGSFQASSTTAACTATAGDTLVAGTGTVMWAAL